MHLFCLSKNVSSLLLILLTLFLLGTLTVLGTVWNYFHVDPSAVILVQELDLSFPWIAAAAAAAMTGGTRRIGAGGRQGVEAREGTRFESKYPHLASWFHALVGDAESHADSGSTAEGQIKRVENKVEKLVQPLDSESAAGAGAQASAGGARVGVGAGAGVKSPSTPSPATAAAAAAPVLGGEKNATGLKEGEKIPRIIHQTWKTDTLPEKWAGVRAECEALHPDYEYMLWTDAESRAFIAKNYAWFTDTFDSYPYAIQRADAIRYFVLYHYGGVYMDLDIGCYKPLDPLLRFEVILPETIPVGVSNDLMFSAPQHPFMEEVVRNLIPFDHQYISHYPTVMFSTGPMFLSASYRIWLDAHPIAQPSTPADPTRGLTGVRILPKILYGKNLPPEEERQHAFFKHYYGSSWHAGDADFIIFLRKSGTWLFILGTCIASLGLLKKLGFVLAPASVLRYIAPLWSWISSFSASARNKHSNSHRIGSSSSSGDSSGRCSTSSSAGLIESGGAEESHSRRPSSEQLLPRYQQQQHPSPPGNRASPFSGFGRGAAGLGLRTWWPSSSAAGNIASRQRSSWSAATPVTSAFSDEKSNYALLPRRESSYSGKGGKIASLPLSEDDDEGGVPLVLVDSDGGASSSRLTLVSSSSSSQQEQLWGCVSGSGPQASSQRIVSWQQAAAASNSNSNSNSHSNISSSNSSNGGSSSSEVVPLHQHSHQRNQQGSASLGQEEQARRTGSLL